MASYGFNFNTSAVKSDDSDDKYIVGINFKDSDGFHFETEENGTLSEVETAAYQKFLTQYIDYAAKSFVEATKAEKKAPSNSDVSRSESNKGYPVASDNLVARLRKLEKENAQLRAEAASAKYKDPNYNKPGDDTAAEKKDSVSKAAKEAVPNTTVKHDDAAKALNRASEAMEKRLKELNSRLDELDSRAARRRGFGFDNFWPF